MRRPQVAGSRHAVLAVVLLIALWQVSPSGCAEAADSVTYPLWSGFTSPQSAWQLSSLPVGSQQQVHFQWLLPQSDSNALKQRFEAVSDPRSAQYQQYMSADDIKQHIRPDAQVTATVLAYLAQHGVDADKSVVDNGDALRVTATVAQVEAMFGTTMGWYQKTSAASTADDVAAGQSRPLLRATAGLTVPASIAAHTRLLLNLVDAPLRGRLSAVMPAGDGETRAALRELQRQIATRSSPLPAESLPSSGHNFHPMQSAPSPDVTGAAVYEPLSCAYYAGRNSTLYAIPNSFVQERYNISSRQSAVGYDGTKVAILGGFTDASLLLNEPIRASYSSADLLNIGAAYNLQQPPNSIDAPWARENDLLNADQLLADGENTLDSQAVYLMSPTAAVALLAINDFGSFYDIFSQILFLLPSQRPHIVSSSIGYGSDSADYLGDGFTDLVDGVLMQLGLVGVTVLVASGDDGAPGVNQACELHPTDLGFNNTNIVSGYPETSPYVLSVGSTDFSYGLGATVAETAQHFQAQYDGKSTTPQFCGSACPDQPDRKIACQSSFITEQAVSVNTSISISNAQFSSSGGFSSYAARPTYQQAVVQQYLDTDCTAANGCSLPPASYFNRTNRGYPDVSIFGNTLNVIAVNGLLVRAGGTSLSAPLFAGIVSRLNEISLRLTNKPLGFINPLLYQMAADTANLPPGQRAFNDIVLGNNVCPEIVGAFNSVLNATLTLDNCLSVCDGYYTAPGWDPVTGLGSPNVAVMEAYLTNLLSNATLAPNVTDPVVPPVSFPSSGPFGTVLAVFTTGLESPASLAMNGTGLLVSDYFRSAINEFGSAGLEQLLSPPVRSNGSLGIAIDEANGILYVGLVTQPALVRYTLATGQSEVVSLPTLPRGLAVQPGTGDLYIAGLYDAGLTILFANGSFGSLYNSSFGLPSCVSFDPTLPQLYVGSRAGGLYGVGSVVALDSEADVLFLIDDTSDGYALDDVTGVAADGLGLLYIVDQGISRVVVVDATYGVVYFSIYGVGAGNPPYNSIFTPDGFVLPFSVAADPRGYYVYVSDGAAGNVVQLAGQVPLPSGSTLGDPQFVGFLGQSFQVHGIDGAVYSLISDAQVQVNGRFAFLGEKGRCVAQRDIRRSNNRSVSSADIDRRVAGPIQCWSHPGSYIGELSVRTAAGMRLLVQPGTTAEGYRRVEVTLDSVASEAKAEAAISVDVTDAQPLVFGDLSVARLSSHHLLLRVGVFVLQLSSSHHFLNIDRAEVSDWDRLTGEVRSHGLLGQTWQRAERAAEGAVKGIEGEVDDYVQAEGGMWGVDNAYNRFVATKAE